jgi:hypothetical protein
MLVNYVFHPFIYIHKAVKGCAMETKPALVESGRTHGRSVFPFATNSTIYLVGWLSTWNSAGTGWIWRQMSPGLRFWEAISLASNVEDEFCAIIEAAYKIHERNGGLNNETERIGFYCDLYMCSSSALYAAMPCSGKSCGGKRHNR